MTKRAGDETEEVQAKFAKIDDSLRKDLESVQDELNKLEQGCREEQIEVQCKFDALKKKHFDSRGELVRKIPAFWKEVILNFGTPAGLIHPNEVEILDYLEDVKLEDNLDKKGSHKFTFIFKENPFFKETTLTKQVKVQDEENVHISATPLTFIKNPLEGLPEEETASSFLHWFQSTDEDGEDDFGSTFREHVWEEAVNVYSPDDIDEGDEEEGDEDDEECDEGDEEVAGDDEEE